MSSSYLLVYIYFLGLTSMISPGNVPRMLMYAVFDLYDVRRMIHAANAEWMDGIGPEQDPSKSHTSLDKMNLRKRTEVDCEVLDEGVRLIEEKGYGVRAAADAIDVTFRTLYDYWKAMGDQGFLDDDQGDDDDDDLSDECGAVIPSSRSGR